MTPTKKTRITNNEFRSRALGYGCAGMIVLSMLVCSGAMVWISKATRTMLVQTGRAGVVDDLHATHLPQTTQSQILTQVDQIIAQYDAGQLGHTQIVHLFDRLATCDALAVAMLYALETHNLPASGLNPHEQILARRQMHRLAYGLTTQTMPHHLFIRATKPLMTPSPNDGRMRWRHTLHDNELRTWITHAQQCADQAKIPDHITDHITDHIDSHNNARLNDPLDDPFKIDHLAMFQTTITQALNENPRATTAVTRQ